MSFGVVVIGAGSVVARAATSHVFTATLLLPPARQHLQSVRVETDDCGLPRVGACALNRITEVAGPEQFRHRDLVLHTT